MRHRTRAIGIFASLAAGVLLLTSAAPTGSPRPIWQAAANQPGSPDAPAVQPGQTTVVNTPVVRAHGEPPPGAIAAADAVKELRSSGNAVDLDSSGVVRAITAAAGKTIGDNSDAFVTRYAAAFGLIKGHTVKATGSAGLPGGDRTQRYQQYVDGLPVLGAEIVVTTTAGGSVRGALAGSSALASTGSTATVSAAVAQATAVAAAVKEFGLGTDGVTANTSLWQYQVTGTAKLQPTYLVKLSEGDGHELATVLVNGTDGSIILTASEHKTAKDRRICDLASVQVNINDPATYFCHPATPLGQAAATRTEGEGSSGNAEVDKAYNHLGAAYDYFKTKFGRDSFDGRGAPINATVRACDLGIAGPTSWNCPFQNAFWEGKQFVFGSGWASDDVAAHEFTHAVTDNASSLFYWGQSGALNEAFSDIFAQYIDLQTPGDDTGGTRRWEIGEDLGSRPDGTSGAIRDMMNPNRLRQPGYMYDTYWVSNLGYDRGGVHVNSGVANRVAAWIYDGGPAGYGIDALGPDRSAQLFYRVLHTLSTGADYTQFGLALNAACRELIGSHGFTRADCRSVDNALRYTYVLDYTTQYETPCNGGLPAVNMFADNFESGDSKWIRSNPAVWSVLPNDIDTFSYAASGRGAANGWARNVTAHNTYLETAASFTVPATGESWLSFNTATMQGSSPGTAGVKVFVKNAQGALGTVNGNNWVGGIFKEWSHEVPLTAFSLQNYAGQQIKLRFVMETPNGNPVDFFLDDVRAYNCVPGKAGPVKEAFAYIEGTDLKLEFNNGYTPLGYPAAFRFDLTYSPAIPGAPTSIQPTDWGPYVHTIPGAVAGEKYTVTIKVHMNDGGYGDSEMVTVIADPRAPITCPISPESTLSPISKPEPSLVQPPTACFRPAFPAKRPILQR